MENFDRIAVINNFIKDLEDTWGTFIIPWIFSNENIRAHRGLSKDQKILMIHDEI